MKGEQFHREPFTASRSPVSPGVYTRTHPQRAGGVGATEAVHVRELCVRAPPLFLNAAAAPGSSLQRLWVYAKRAHWSSRVFFPPTVLRIKPRPPPSNLCCDWSFSSSAFSAVVVIPKIVFFGQVAGTNTWARAHMWLSNNNNNNCKGNNIIETQIFYHYFFRIYYLVKKYKRL